MVKSLGIVAVVFLLGVATGGALVYATGRPGGGPVDPEQRAELLTRRLKLRPEQRAAVLEQLRRHRDRLQAGRAELISGVRQVLDEEQRRRFDAVLSSSSNPP